MVLEVIYAVLSSAIPSGYYLPAAIVTVALIVVYAFAQGRTTTRERDLHARVVLVTVRTRMLQYLLPVSTQIINQTGGFHASRSHPHLSSRESRSAYHRTFALFARASLPVIDHTPSPIDNQQRENLRRARRLIRCFINPSILYPLSDRQRDPSGCYRICSRVSSYRFAFWPRTL